MNPQPKRELKTRKFTVTPRGDWADVQVEGTRIGLGDSHLYVYLGEEVVAVFTAGEWLQVTEAKP